MSVNWRHVVDVPNWGVDSRSQDHQTEEVRNPQISAHFGVLINSHASSAFVDMPSATPKSVQ